MKPKKRSPLPLPASHRQGNKMSNSRPWVLLWIWCGQQFNREDFADEEAAFIAAYKKRRDLKDVTRLLLIDPDGYICEISKGKP